MVTIKIDLCRVKNSHSLHKTFNVEPLYLQHENTGSFWPHNCVKHRTHTNRRLNHVTCIDQCPIQHLIVCVNLRYASFSSILIGCLIFSTNQKAQKLSGGSNPAYQIHRNLPQETICRGKHFAISLSFVSDPTNRN